MIKNFILLYIIISCALAFRRQTQHGVRDNNRGIIFPNTNRETSIEDKIRDAFIANPQAKNISQILTLLNVQFSEQDSILGRQSKKFASPATCEPELTTVKVDADNSIDQYFIPFCVRVKRCSGCCPSGFECVPNAKLSKPVRGARLRRSRRSEEGLKGEYVTMQVEEHQSCSCVCKIREDHCDPLIHNYSARECKCACKNMDELTKCASSTLPKQWNADECKCKCKNVSHCSSGQIFSHETCSCVQA